MYLMILVVGLALLFASIRRPLIGLLAMTMALQIEFFFMGSLPAGITLGRAAGLCAMVGWLVNRRKYRPSPLLFSVDLAVPAILFIVVIVISALFARDLSAAMSQAIRIAMLLFLGVMVGEIINTRRDLLALFWVIVLSVAMGAGVALLQFNAYQEGGEMIGNVYNVREGVRFEGLTSNANALGIQLLSGIPFLFCLFFTSRRGWVRLLCMGLLGLSAFVLVLTVSRSTIYPLVVYLAVAYVLHRKLGKHLIAENVMIAIAALMLCFAVLQSSSYVWERISRPVVDLESDTSFSGRMDILKQGPAIMRLSPIVGVGLDNTRQYTLLQAAHDTISALLGETGLLGTILFTAFCVAIVRRQVGILRRARLAGDSLQQELAIALAGMLCILIVWTPVKVIFYQRLFWLWAGLVVWMDSRLPAGRRVDDQPPRLPWRVPMPTGQLGFPTRPGRP
jgi:O-antigen ligase